MVGEEEILRELALVLADPRFLRSPVQSRLLEYLVKESIAGRGEALKSYSVAIEGLGRESNFDLRHETYPRVQVARLRKSLRAYYESAGKNRSRRLMIANGSYAVKFAADDKVESLAASFVPERNAGRVRLAVSILLACFLLVLPLTWWGYGHFGRSDGRWSPTNFPTVFFSVNGPSDSAEQVKTLNELKNDLAELIQGYEWIKPLNRDERTADFIVKIEIYDSIDDSVAISIQDKVSRNLYYKKIKIKNSRDRQEIRSLVNKEIFIITHPTGPIHSFARRLGVAADTPYGCWLRFSGLVQLGPSVNDREFEACAIAWHRANPSNPLAAGLYAWMLIDQSIVAPADYVRKRKLREASDVLQEACLLYPDSLFLRIVAARSAAFSGDHEALRVAAREILRINPDNLDAVGLAGTFLVFSNDPLGEPMLDGAIARHFNPPPGLFVGKFIAAMMRQDSGSAAAALDRLEHLNRTLAVRPILSAALLGHDGQVPEARAQWREAIGVQPLLAIDADIYLRALPLAPAVRDRLRQWLDSAIRESTGNRPQPHSSGQAVAS